MICASTGTFSKALEQQRCGQTTAKRNVRTYILQKSCHTLSTCSNIEHARRGANLFSLAQQRFDWSRLAAGNGLHGRSESGLQQATCTRREKIDLASCCHSLAAQQGALLTLHFRTCF